MGGIEIFALLLILLAKAQKAVTPAAAANDAEQKAHQAAADAAAAAQQGDHATAAQKNAEAQQHAARAQAARTPPPWPQAVPDGLPPYPGPQWHAAAPVTAAMAARAWQLLPQLWGHGEGTWKLEKTGPDWVVYKAAYTSPGKKGVVALTPPAGVQFAPAPAAAPGPTAQAAIAPQQHGAPPPGAPSHIVPASTTALSQAGVQTLRVSSPRMSGPTVVWLQQQLGIPTDGVYGPGTAAAVQHYQSSHGLTPDGVVGPKTWASFGVGQKAAA